MNQPHDNRTKEALKYHSRNRPGKIEVTSTKPCVTASELSLAYTPGVAAPCLEISKNPEDAYKYTSKGNLVGVISNGSAVLGLGNIGPLAGKPVMEGKGILFKRFADIDVFDLEINESTVDGMVRTIKALEPTFGGINLEDIKAPECFEVEQQLIKELNIPVFHDDQHGTAIIASAALLNALTIIKKSINNIKIVFSGAGAAAMATANLIIELGANPLNITMCDSKGVIFKGRQDGMNKYKEKFALETKNRTLKDAIKNADVFMGLSGPNILNQEMIKLMSKTPIVFAMSNPTPEIFPEEVLAANKNAIVATGRSDYPNQVNNVLGFPFIFRGALDVRATEINLEMKLAAVYALANLAKEEVPDEVKLAYQNENFSFGRDYLIPKPFDTRVLTAVAPAVAKAAMDSNVAQIQIDDLNEYSSELEAKLGTSAIFMKSIRDNLKFLNRKNKKKLRVAFAEGSNSRVLNAVKMLLEHDLVEPVLLGYKDRVLEEMEKVNFTQHDSIEIITPSMDHRYEEFFLKYHSMKQREGVTIGRSMELMAQRNYFGAMLAREGHVDTFLNGPTQNYPECFIPINNVISTRGNVKAAGIYILIFKQRTIFLADCTVQINPSAQDLCEIAASTAELYKEMLNKEPQISFLSFSNFGSNRHPSAKKVSNAVALCKEQFPNLNCDGEMQADVAMNENILNNLFDFSEIPGPADILIFPDLNSSNISYKLLTQLSEATAIGPLLIPMNNSVNTLARTTTVSEIVNMTVITALMGHKK
jgi:malate dehydrogenase (oxaloacetate-decarboxylating)(NADP+)